MSHLVQMPKGDRVSLKTLFAKPNVPVQLGIALFTPGLTIVPLAENGDPCGSCDVTPVKTAKPDTPVYQLKFRGSGTFRVELRMGGAMWDWLRVDTKNAASSDADNGFKGTGKVKVEVLWTKRPVERNPMPHYKTVAEMMLKTHGYALDIKGQDFDESRKLDFGDIITGVSGDNGNLGALSKMLSEKKADYNRGDKLYVVVGPARENYDVTKDSGNLTGMTVESDNGAVGKPYIILNMDNQSGDGATLLHEMCHAAGYHHPANFNPKNEERDDRNLMSYGPRRNRVNKGHIERLQKAFFHAD